MYGHARGKVTEIESVVTAYEPPRLLRWHHEVERVDGRVSPVIYAKDAVAEVTIEAAEGGSLVTYRLIAAPGRLLYWLMLGVLARLPIERAFETSLARLEEVAS
jgi:hypothetical protein